MYNFVASEPQHKFIHSTARYPAFVAGYGSGKTMAGVMRTFVNLTKNPHLNQAYCLPTFDLISKTAVPRFSELFKNINLEFTYNEQKKAFSLRGYGGKILLVSLDRPASLVSWETADNVVDELDTLPAQKAFDVFTKIITRDRSHKLNGEQNTTAVCTTPEGLGFVYRNWKASPLEGSELIQASTYSNLHNLPPDYIDKLKSTLPDQALKAHVYGQFVNLRSQGVYSQFDREKNCTDVTVGEEKTLHIGMDFNVMHMSAVVHIIKGDTVYAVDEFVDYDDTTAIIDAIRTRYDSSYTINIYPDASGASRTTSGGGNTDHSLLRMAGFIIRTNSKNPLIRDRVNSFNFLINKAGVIRYYVNIKKCSKLVSSLEEQAYDKNGVPDKSGGHDHIVDAAGYFVSYKYPINKTIISNIRIRGLGY